MCTSLFHEPSKYTKKLFRVLELIRFDSKSVFSVLQLIYLNFKNVFFVLQFTLKYMVEGRGLKTIKKMEILFASVRHIKTFNKLFLI